MAHEKHCGSICFNDVDYWDLNQLFVHNYNEFEFVCHFFLFQVDFYDCVGYFCVVSILVI